MSPTAANGSPLLRRFGGALAAALLLSLPVFAAWKLTTPVAQPAVTIAPEDDAVRDLRIVKEPRQPSATPAATSATDAPAEIMLENWVNTDHPRPSPHG
jgi:hypothetical protein